MPHCAACGDEHPDANSLCPRTGEVTTQGPCGTRIDRYDVERWIGGGGMGAVYLARHSMLQHQVALKLLHPTIAQRGDILERFLREARATASLGSPHIVKVFDCAVTPEGTAFIAMEALAGESLQALIDRDRRVEPGRAVSVARQVLEGLSVAHAAGIVHRDMKPGNVFLTPAPGGRGEERATILDFGISKIRSGSAASLTQTGTVMGTPHYMAPEQIWNSKDIDHRADLYAVGVMLYEMLAGRLPFDAASTAELLVKACTTDPIPLRALQLPLPTALVAVVDRAMSRDPAQRFATAADFAEALRGSIAPAPTETSPRAVRFEPVLDPRMSSPSTVLGAAPPAPPTPQPSQPRGVVPAGTSGRTVLYVVVAAFVVLALFFVGSVAWFLAAEEGEATAHDAGFLPGMVPLGSAGENVAPGSNGGVTLHPGPGGITLQPTAAGLRVIPGGNDGGMLIPMDPE